MKPNLRYLPSIVALASLGTLMLPASTFAQQLSYNQPGDGDLMTMDVMVDATADTTYFSSLGWNPSGDFRGNTGFQTSGTSQLVIFSLWDPARPVDASGITTIYKKPGASTGRFSDDGAGMQYIDRSYGWSVGKSVTSVVRTWPAGNKSDVGMWTFDSATGIWSHHATFRYPQSSVFLGQSPGSFLQTWPGINTGKPRRANFYNGWKRTPTGWKPLNNATANGMGLYGTSANRFFLATGSLASPNIALGLTIPSGSAPAMTPTKTTSVVAIREPSTGLTSTVSIGWNTDAKAGPQFKYKAQVLDRNGVVLGETSGTDPDAHRAVVPFGPHAPGPGLDAIVGPIAGIVGDGSPASVRLTLTNLFDVDAPPVTVPVTALPVAGRTYRIDSLSTGTAITVPAISVAAGTALVLAADAQKVTPFAPNPSLPVMPIGGTNAAAQSWMLRSTRVPDEFMLVVQHSYQCMDVGSMWPGKAAAPATQYPCSSPMNQIFRLQRQLDNSFAIKPKIGDTCLQLDPAAGLTLTRQACTGELTQAWRFTER